MNHLYDSNHEGPRDMLSTGLAVCTPIEKSIEIRMAEKLPVV